jgi:hypothetical protein
MPPNSTPRLPKYRHQKARNLAVVRIAGHDHYLGPFDSPESHAEYRRLVGEWLATGVTPTPPKGDQPADISPTLNELMVG